MERHIDISRFDYDLPDERIAKFPLAERSASKLLVWRGGEIAEKRFADIGDVLPAGELLVFNNTKVIRARIVMHKLSGARIEVFCLEPHDPADYERAFAVTGGCTWSCIVGNLKKWKEGALTKVCTVKGKDVTLQAQLDRSRTAQLSGGTNYWVDFSWDDDSVAFAEILDAIGELPIPPYLNRETEETDKTTYQTVYSKIKGSVAAPTAGLHFTQKVLADIDAHGIDREEVTLHVGAGTFKPVKSEEIEGHAMHTEYIAVRRQTFEKLLAHECHATAVGTTSVRTLESLYYMGVKLAMNPDAQEEDLHVNQWEPYDLPHNEEGLVIVGGKAVTAAEAIGHLLHWLDAAKLDVLHSSTQIIIAPGYTYKIVDKLITNFHQPQSTLLLLVSAFVKGDWRKIYDYALAHDFRFLSYGDSSLLIP